MIAKSSFGPLANFTSLAFTRSYGGFYICTVVRGTASHGVFSSTISYVVCKPAVRFTIAPTEQEQYLSSERWIACSMAARSAFLRTQTIRRFKGKASGWSYQKPLFVFLRLVAGVRFELTTFGL